MRFLPAVRTSRSFFLRIILPAILSISLFVTAIFAIIIPASERIMLSGKREMIKELTNSAWSIVSQYARQAAAGEMAMDQARKEALFSINYLRYGDEVRDYFWVTDLTPRMLTHPFRPDLNGEDLRTFEDPDGKRLFVEFVDTAVSRGEGYVEYVWEDKSDPEQMVPKLSYVKLFEPWGWVIGTGIYLEDVEHEISELTGWLVEISLLITAVIVLLLFYVTRESLKIEAERVEKKENLKESREKYRQLAEASTEGVLMIIDSRIVYSNNLFRELTGFSDMDLADMRFHELLLFEPKAEGAGEPLADEGASNQCERRIKKKDGTCLTGFMTVSRMALGGRDGHIVTVSDPARLKKIGEGRGRGRHQYRQLIDTINVGVFRVAFGRKGQVLEVNPAAAAMLGFDSVEHLLGIPVRELFCDGEERRHVIKKLALEHSVRHYPLRLRHRSGGGVAASISAVLVRDESGRPRHCDGIVEGRRGASDSAGALKSAADELQTGLLLLNKPIRHIPHDPLVSCLPATPVRIAAKLMNEAGTGAALVRSEEKGEFLGIVTDHDISKRQVAGDLADDTPVLRIMSAPLVWVPEDGLILQGLLAMLENNVGHVAVRSHDGRMAGIIGAMHLLRSQRYPLAMVLRDIRSAEAPAQLFKVRKRLLKMMAATYSSLPDSRLMSHVISVVAEEVMKKCIAFAIAELGPPPCAFAFLALGSAGRQEQTLVTDQDNAIIYADGAAGDPQAVSGYFLGIGERVCRWLDSSGYSLCAGDVMAMNPKWCQPLSVWKGYFKQWVSTLEPADLLETKIFFDFRCVCGDQELVDGLRGTLDELVRAKPLFLFHLVHNCLQFKAPLGVFKTIVVESAGEHREKFSLKKAMTPIIDLARIYALRHRIADTNTSGRLTGLEAVGHLSAAEFRELTMVYRCLLDLRLKHQLAALADGREPDNHVNPKALSSMEQALVREALSQINSFQTKMSFDFTGSA